MRLFRLLTPLFLLAGMAFGQSGAIVQTNFTAAASSVAIPAAQLAYHRLVISNASTTFTACTVAIDSSPDGTTWTAGGIMSQFVNNCLNTTVLSSSTPVTSKFVRVTVTTLTGTGLNVDITYSGSSTPYEKELCAGTPVAININTAATTQLVTATGGVAEHICSYEIVAAGATNVTIEAGTGGTCAANTVVYTGAIPMAANTRIGNANYPELFRTAQGSTICLINSAAVQISGYMIIAKY